MRLYSTLKAAAHEIRRDIFSGQPVSGTRVQQRRGKFDFVERLGYGYGISGELKAWPQTPEELVDFGREEQFPGYAENGPQIARWLHRESLLRAYSNYGQPNSLTEPLHPALMTTLEGSWPSYTYTERLTGAIPALVNALISARDTRRAFWPIFRPEDALRASAPTRIPCSLGYQVLIRETDLGSQLYLVYLERSADFDHFWLTDIWLARQFQLAVIQAYSVATNEVVSPGPVIHQLISFHSFEVAHTEVY